MTLSIFGLGWFGALGLLLICVGVGWFIFSSLKTVRPEVLDIQRKSRLLTVGERKLFTCLTDALSEKYVVFAKVPLGEVVEASSRVKLMGLNRIGAALKGHHFDFILCQQSDMSIFGVVELEYSKGAASHKKESTQRKQRDRLVTQVCKSANLKLFYFDARQDYQNMDIARLITGKSKQTIDEQRMSPTHQSQLTIDDASHSIDGYPRSCPKCHSEIVTKVSVKGSNIGEKFLMCRKYPYCDFRVSMKDLDSLKKLEREERIKSNAEGFKNWSSG